MSDTAKPLRPANPAEVKQALRYALLFEGRKRVHQADNLMAEITVERLMQHLQRCGFVLMKAPDAVAPSANGHMPKRDIP